MADSLDMSLDDLITKNKAPQHRRGRHDPTPAFGGRAPTGRRFQNRAATRDAAGPYHQPNFQNQAPPPPPCGYVAQPIPMPMTMVAAPSATTDTATKLYISNLDYNVTNEDIKELFSEVGVIKRYSINYDKSGRSKGTAEVVFSTRSDAIAALRKYNDVHLDGKPMKIEIIGTNVESPAPAIFTFTTPPLPPPGNFNFPSNSGPGRGGGGRRGWPQGGGGFRGRGGPGRGVRGRGRGGRGNLEISAEDLDAELDKYHSQATKTS